MCDFLSVVDPASGSFATLLRLSKRLLAVNRSLLSELGQVSNSYQVVGGGCELEDPTHQLQSPVAGFAQQPHSLQPAEDFFHSFALSLTDLITRMARRARIDVEEVRKARTHLFDGTYNFRKIRGANRLSTHSWAISIDIDSAKNPQGKPYDESKGMMPKAVVKIFEAEGWKWGGRFGGKRVSLRCTWSS